MDANRSVGEQPSRVRRLAADFAYRSVAPAADASIPTPTFDDLVRTHSVVLRRLAVSLVGWNDADDLVSSTVVTLWQTNAWLDATNPRAFSCAALVKAAASHHRSAFRRRSREQRAESPTSSTDRPDPDPALGRALDNLSVRQRAVIHLAYWEDMTPQSIAQLLGMSDGTVRRHLARARSSLRRELQ